MHVSCQQRAIADDDIVADDAIVSDVRDAHQKTIIADDRGAFRFRAAMHRAVLAKDVAVADPQIAAAVAVELQILWLMPDDRAHVDLVVPPDLRVARDIRVGPNPCPRANLHVLLDDRMRPDLDGRDRVPPSDSQSLLDEWPYSRECLCHNQSRNSITERAKAANGNHNLKTACERCGQCRPKSRRAAQAPARFSGFIST